jgi:PEP-CTERM/exosortase A-associated glycosyltransferase
MFSERYLIVNADDFGRSADINRGVIKAYEEGIVTSASLMVLPSSGVEAATFARSNPELSVGLHIYLGEWIYRDDTWLRIDDVVPLDDSEAVSAEVARQLSIFRELMGKDPTHLDSHQHLHRAEPLQSALIDLAQELKVPLRHYNAEICHCGEFYGQTSNGFPFGDAITPDALIRIVSALPSGLTEISCHPAFGGDSASFYSSHGLEEANTLCDSRVYDSLSANGIKLCSFQNVSVGPQTAMIYQQRTFQERGIDCYDRGDYSEAASWFRRVSAIHPSRPSAWLWLSRAQAKIGNHDASLESVSKALELQPDWSEATEHFSSLLSRYSRGRNGQNSLERRETIPRFKINDPVASWKSIALLNDQAIDKKALAHVAETLWADGHIDAPCRAFERAVRLSPGDAALRHSYNMAIAEADVLGGRWRCSEDVPARYEPVRGRVLHVVNKSLPYSQVGYTLRTHYVAKAQRMAGLDPHVVTLLGFPWDHGVDAVSLCDEVDGIRYHRLPTTKGIPSRLDLRLSQNVSQLIELVKELKPAVIHAASDYQNALVALEVGRLCNLPVVYEVRGFWEDHWLSKRDEGAKHRERYIFSREQELHCMLAADRIVTLAEVMKQRMAERGVPPDKITIIPNAVDSETFVPCERDAQLAARFGIDPNDVVVGYISTFWRFEGIKYLIDAVAKLVNRGHRIRCLLVGDGEERLRLEAQTTALGIADRVIFTGAVPHEEILKYYGLVNVFVVPRTADNISKFVTPLKPLEAMATGRAMVVSRVPALEEMIQDGVTGQMFSPEDAESLAGVIEPLLTDPSRRKNLGEAAREWVRENRTWERNAAIYREVYEALGAA